MPRFFGVSQYSVESKFNTEDLSERWKIKKEQEMAEPIHNQETEMFMKNMLFWFKEYWAEEKRSPSTDELVDALGCSRSTVNKYASLLTERGELVLRDGRYWLASANIPKQKIMPMIPPPPPNEPPISQPSESEDADPLHPLREAVTLLLTYGDNRFKVMKRCSHAGCKQDEYQDISEFHYHSKKGYQSHCKSCMAENYNTRQKIKTKVDETIEALTDKELLERYIRELQSRLDEMR